MEKKRSGKRTQTSLIVVAILAAVGISAWLYFKKEIKTPNSVLQQNVEKKIETVAEKENPKIVKEASDSLYDLHYANINVDLDKGFAVINNLKLKSNNAIAERLLTEHRLPNNIIRFSADKIIVNNIGLKKIKNETALRVGNITIINPRMIINNKLQGNNDTSSKISWLSQLSKKVFSSVDFDALVDMQVDNMILKNSTIIYTNSNSAKPKTTRLNNLDISIKNFSTDALANKGKKGQPAIVSIAYQRIITADKLYFIDFNDMRIIPTENKLYVGSFELLPTLSKQAFVKAVKAGKANFRYHLKSTGITMNNVNIDKLIKKQQLHIPEVDIDYSWGEIYSNYSWPLRNPPNRRDKYPHELLQKLAFDVTIDKMRVKNGDLYFRIIPKSTGKEAVFSMNQTRSIFTNITNNVAAKMANPYTTIVSDYKVMNTGNMHSVYKLNLEDKNGSYTVSSTLGPMDGTAYNPLIEPLALMQIKSQKIQKMQLDMTVDEYKAVGNIDFYYKDYKVRLLKQTQDTLLKNRSLISFASNIILPNDNPKKNGKFRKGPINIIRDPKESFFGFQWRAMLDGLSSSLTGADQNKDKPKNKITQMGKLFYGPGKGQEHKSTGGDVKRLDSLKRNGDNKN